MVIKRSQISINGNGRTTALEHIHNLISTVTGEVKKRESHSPECQCISCSGRMFGDTMIIDRGKKVVSGSDTPKDILIRSKEKDDALIEEAEQLAARKIVDEAKINTLLQKSLIYITAGGLVALAINIIIRALIAPSLSVIVGSAIAMIVLAIINERIK